MITFKSKLILWIALIVFVFCPWAASKCHADSFEDDLSDKPGWNLGTNCLESGVCAGVSWVLKVGIDNAGRRDIDFMPAAMLTAASLLIHLAYFREGGQNAGDALAETAFEVGGAWTPVILF